jgi:hypothetical protein
MLIWQLGAGFLAILAEMAYYLISQNADNALLMRKLRFFARLARPLHIDYSNCGLIVNVKIGFVLHNNCFWGYF